MKIYIASSWKNANRVMGLITVLRNLGYVVYDFTHHSFNWAELDIPDAKEEARIDGRDKLATSEWLNHPKVCTHYRQDLAALNACDALIAIFPCGNSTHIEAGFVAGRGKEIYALSDEPLGRDLLYKLFREIFSCEADLIDFLEMMKMREEEIKCFSKAWRDNMRGINKRQVKKRKER